MNDYPLPAVHATTVHMLADATVKARERVALICGDRQLTYAEYGHCVAGFANELVKAGAAGNRVVLLSGNSIDMAIAMYAIQAAGGQAVPLNPLYTERELRQIFDDAAPAIVIYDSALHDTVAPLLGGREVLHVVKLGGSDGRLLDEWRDEENIVLPFPAPSDLACLLYTGGTTGLPKGVNIEHQQTTFNLSQFQALVPTRADKESILCMMPMFHTFAMHCCLYNAVYARSTLVILPRYHPEAVLRAVEAQRITILPAGPTVFIGLLAHEQFSNTDFSALHYCISGSAALSEQVLEQWQEGTGCLVVEGYGQTESGPVLTFNPVRGIRKPGSVGFVVPNAELQIVDVETGTKQLSAGEPGEIRARGPQMMSGYRNRPEENAATLRDGWLYTGDIGEFDEDAYLYIRDRKKDMIIVSGYNVYPREVDEVLLTHPAVMEASAIGVPDDYRGEMVKAFVALQADATCSEADLIDYCRVNLAKYKVPTEISILEVLPKTAVGKLDKKQLRNI